MSEETKARLGGLFPYLLACFVPLGGVALAAWRVTERDFRDAGFLLAISAVAALIWALALGFV